MRSEDAVGTSWRRPHLRTPGYLFGATGVVERLMGSFSDPSLLAYGISAGAALPLYRVRFRLSDLWSGVEAEERETTVTVDLYGNWLRRPQDEEPITSDVHDDENQIIHQPNCDLGHSHDHSHAHSHGHDAHGDGHSHGHDAHVDARVDDDHHGHDAHVDAHGDDDRHGHDAHVDAHGDDDRHGHSHGTRHQIERAAVELEGPPRPGVAVHEALRRLAIRKGLATAEQLRTTATALESAATTLPGADLMVRAWLDANFKLRLLHDANEAAAELGIVASNPNAPTKRKLAALRQQSRPDP